MASETTTDMYTSADNTSQVGFCISPQKINIEGIEKFGLDRTQL